MQAARTLIVIESTRRTLEKTMLNTIIQTVSFSLMSLTVLATTAVVVWSGLPI